MDMLTFRTIQAQLLSESEERIAAIMAKFKDKLTDEQIDKLAAADPTPNKIYTQWLAVQAVRIPQFWEDLRRTAEDLRTYNSFKQRLAAEHRDINRIKDYRELFTIIGPIRDAKSGKEIKREEVQETLKGAKLIYSGPEGKVWTPETVEASKFLGRGTRWCTAANSSNQFKYYNKQGPLYVFLMANGKKWQLHLHSNQFANETDASEPVANVQREPLVQKVLPMIYKTIVNPKFEEMMTMSKYLAHKPPQWMNTLADSLPSSGNPRGLIDFIKTFNGERWTAAEPKLAKLSAEVGFAYAKNIQKRFEAAEPEIAKSDKLSFAYAKEVVKGRFHAGEPMILKNITMALDYGEQVVGGEWPELANIVKKFSLSAVEYAIRVVKNRWPEVEERIMGSPMASYKYREFLKREKGIEL